MLESCAQTVEVRLAKILNKQMVEDIRRAGHMQEDWEEEDELDASSTGEEEEEEEYSWFRAEEEEVVWQKQLSKCCV